MLLLVSLFIVSNTVRLTIFSRRLEISIMKDVGATDGFIRWPFMVEGMGNRRFIRSAVSWGRVGNLWRWQIKAFSSVLVAFGIGAAPFSAYAGWILLGFIALGLLTGMVGCAISMKRYLKNGGGSLG